MAIPGQRTDREYDKFTDDGSGNTAVRVVGNLTVGQDNDRTKVLNSNDLISAYTWLDFGTKNERVDKIDYTSATQLPGQTVRRQFAYSLVSGKYRLNSETWSIV